MHLALCDQLGQRGPFNEDPIALSRLISVAVDFAKHGKCVSKQDYEKIEAKMERYPDFMDSGSLTREIVESKLVLGQIYRGVDCKAFYIKCLLSEHNNSIRL